MINLKHIVMIYLSLISCSNTNQSQYNSDKNDSLLNHQMTDSSSSNAHSQTALYNKKRNGLPQIDSLKYLPFSYGSINNGESLLKIFKYYDERRPNIGKYNTYYIRIDCQSAVDSTFSSICKESYSVLGFLILYDPYSRFAYAILVEYNFLADSSTHSMWFSIDKKNVIVLREDIMIDNGIDEQGVQLDTTYEIGRHLIKISNEGRINIHSTNNF